MGVNGDTSTTSDLAEEQARRASERALQPAIDALLAYDLADVAGEHAAIYAGRPRA